MDQQLKLQHFLWRTGFGPSPTDWQQWNRTEPRTWWQKAKAASAAKPTYIDVAGNAIKGLLQGAGDLATMESDLDKEQRKRIREQSRDDLRSLNLVWLDEMANSKAQLREKVALFWHGHFASRNINILYQQLLLQVLRTHGLGNFRTLLSEVSKSAAMLAFLNNQQNRKKSPNENFAREVMELFTLGRGHYTENDIKEAARAFTGWGFRLNGEFVFRQHHHDADEKNVLGKTGRFNGDDVLDILLEKRQTAYFIAQKAYRFFVNESRVPAERIKWLGDRFYDNNYEIMRLLEDIFTSTWFFEAENVGCNIKSPIELWVGIRRTLNLSLQEPKVQLSLQKSLGQILFFPPNVAGWPGGRNWIDSSSLLLRMRLPQFIASGEALEMNAKTDDDQEMGQAAKNRLAKRFEAEINWKTLEKQVFGASKSNETLPQLARYLWQTPTALPPLAVLNKHTPTDSPTTQLRSGVIQLMATPEYQMC